MSDASNSPSRNPFVVLGARITRALSRDGASIYTATASVAETDRGSFKSNNFTIPVSAMSDQTTPLDRSRSRGRELFSTGRGGAGNIHRSLSRDGTLNDTISRQETIPESLPRGREPAVGVEVTHVGRGGIGNVRSPSRKRDPSGDVAQATYENGLIERHEESPHAFSTGRGGAGNIKTPESSRSRSRGPGLGQSPDALERSQSRGRVLHSTGRGGAGNMSVSGAGDSSFGALAEEDDLAHIQSNTQQGVHSTGRGGLANLTSLASPPPESTAVAAGPADGVFSMGRGGAGNIRDRSGSRGPSASRERHQHTPSALGRIIDRVKGHGHEGEKEKTNTQLQPHE